MNLYISDLHFGHANAINFDHRPFLDVDEMDKFMIELWNGRVAPDDDVYILGDFWYKGHNDPVWYLQRLRGKKHLVIGNHDGVIMKSSRAQGYFESIDKMEHVTDRLRVDKAEKPVQICLCHFPIAEWNGMRHGAWHIYGHIHANKDATYQIMRTRENAYNAAACINNYTPASLSELIRNNERFRAMEADEMQRGEDGVELEL